MRIAGTAVLLVVLLAAVLLSDDPQTVPGGPLVCENDGVSDMTPAFGKPMPDVAVVSLDGTPVMLHELGGRELSVILFCSYRCPCSDGYVDRLRDLQKKNSPRGVAFIALDANSNENISGLAAYAARKEYPLAIYMDDLTAAADEMNAQVTPEVFVFDNTWNLRYHGRIDDDKSGMFVKEQSLQLALDTLLSGAPLLTKEKPSLGCAIVRNVEVKKGKSSDPG